MTHAPDVTLMQAALLIRQGSDIETTLSRLSVVDAQAVADYVHRSAPVRSGAGWANLLSVVSARKGRAR